jgi:hypothetical protein
LAGTVLAPTPHPSPNTTVPSVQLLACNGTTGSEGCGPGWVWNGNRCVPCG